MADDTPPTARPRLRGGLLWLGATLLLILAVGSLVVAITRPDTSAQWVPTTLPPPSTNGYSQVASISCTSASFCMAVGAYGNVRDYQTGLSERWNGSSWVRIANPASLLEGGPFTLTSVSCANPSFCMAGGEVNGTQQLIEEWNGSRWAPSLASPPTSQYPYSVIYSLSCASPSMCMAVGADFAAAIDYLDGVPIAEQWDGRSWTAAAAFSEQSEYAGVAVSCPTPVYCLAIDDPRYAGGGGFVAPGHSGPSPVSMTWDGRAWTTVDLPNPSGERTYMTLASVSCASSTACVAVGSIAGGTPDQFPPGNNVPFTVRWDGRGWAESVTLTSQNNTRFQAVSCVTPAICVAAGDDNDNPAQSADGFSDVLDVAGSGRVVASTASAGIALDAVGCTSSGFCAMAGEHWTGLGTSDVAGYTGQVTSSTRVAAIAICSVVTVLALGVAAWMLRRRRRRGGLRVSGGAEISA